MHAGIDKKSIFEEKSTYMNRAAISGDIIAYTSLSNTDKNNIETAIKFLFKDLKENFEVYGRIIKGDYIECYIPNPANALRVALAIKSCIKSVTPDENGTNNRRIDVYKTHGIRLAIGIGEIGRLDLDEGIIDGDAIYYSGRTISDSRTTSDKERIVIKNTLFIKTNSEEVDSIVDPLLALLDVLTSKSTAKQSKVLYLKLLGKNEEDIAKILKLSQSTVNKHSTSLGWNAIEKTVSFFEQLVNTKL